MPHIIVKMYKGRTPEQKNTLSKEICKAVVSSVGTDSANVSVSIEEYDPSDWHIVEQYEIEGKPDALYMKKGRIIKR